MAPINMAIANFIGVLGFRLLLDSFNQINENKGAKVTMAIGFMF
jgi:hypothetical protein